VIGTDCIGSCKSNYSNTRLLFPNLGIKSCKYLYVFKTKIKVISKKKQQPKTAHMILITFKVKKQFQEKEELQAKLTEYEKYKDKLYKREEETEELQGLATQELAKIKHLVNMIDSDQRPDSNRCPLLILTSTDVIISNHGPN
jgi:hypothetical protein